jgi:hypothetical protein
MPTVHTNTQNPHQRTTTEMERNNVLMTHMTHINAHHTLDKQTNKKQKKWSVKHYKKTVLVFIKRITKK